MTSLRGLLVLWLRMLSLSVVLALAILAVQIVGRAQPLSRGLTALHLTDCALPCWMGITPGQTPYDEAVQRISSAYPQIALAQTALAPRFSADTPFGQILLAADRRGVVRRLTIHVFNLKEVDLGSVVSLLGIPTWHVGRHPTAIYYGCATYLTVVAGRSADGGWRQPIALIDIQDVGYSCPAS